MASRQEDAQVMEGSKNVFADLGVAEPEEELAKAQLASHIRGTIERRPDPSPSGGPNRCRSAEGVGADQWAARRLFG